MVEGGGAGRCRSEEKQSVMKQRLTAVDAPVGRKNRHLEPWARKDTTLMTLG